MGSFTKKVAIFSAFSVLILAIDVFTKNTGDSFLTGWLCSFYVWLWIENNIADDEDKS